jgi:ClpP class serine protease
MALLAVASNDSFFSQCLLLLRSEFQTVTAGKFKRTLTPTKKVNAEDVRKTKQDIEQILVLFKGFVHQNRPSLDIESVATGETWFGTDALAMGLCDEIKTTDTVLGEYVDQGCNVYEVKYEEPTTGALAKLLPRTEGPSSGWIGSAVRWVVRTVAQEVQSELASLSSRPVDQQFMMKDDTKDRFRFD